jgi:hypothetical protein
MANTSKHQSEITSAENGYSIAATGTVSLLRPEIDSLKGQESRSPVSSGISRYTIINNT